MLRLTIPAREQWDERKQEFVNTKEQTLQLEHSLVSLSKWESKWEKPFLTNQAKTYEETIDYVKCMTINQNVDPAIYSCLDNSHFERINKYIEAPMTATYFSEKKGGRGSSREQVTSELIYYWMIALQIPMECEKWHLNRLLTLVKVCNIKNSPPKKHSRRELMSRNAALNAARRQQMNSQG